MANRKYIHILNMLPFGIFVDAHSYAFSQEKRSHFPLHFPNHQAGNLYLFVDENRLYNICAARTSNDGVGAAKTICRMTESLIMPLSVISLDASLVLQKRQENSCLRRKAGEFRCLKRFILPGFYDSIIAAIPTQSGRGFDGGFLPGI
ncbi:hypothetical protein WA026_009115 [Henosepilachna vigintioctopunctata]|uniref:Uncharacterized protein n=1 Tax=Henosepilachna vigintioctopunctata TaxID=420089 RepID=A0AAW1UY31_9CUCU